MKSCTDIEQSKILNNILPYDTADMYYQYVLPWSSTLHFVPAIGNPSEALKWYNMGYEKTGQPPMELNNFCVPCWSLTALLDILNNKAYSIDEDATVTLSSYKTVEWDLSIINSGLETVINSDPIDACVEMILKLKDKGLS